MVSCFETIPLETSNYHASNNHDDESDGGIFYFDAQVAPIEMDIRNQQGEIKQPGRSILKRDDPALSSTDNLNTVQRRQSCPAIFETSEHDEEEKITTKSVKPKRSSLSVTFTNVNIRNYDITIGDHPCVSHGTPLSLDWTFTDDENGPQSIDDFEDSRINERKTKRRHLRLNYFERQCRLIHGFGFTEDELKYGVMAKENKPQSRGQKRVLSSCKNIIIGRNNRGANDNLWLSSGRRNDSLWSSSSPQQQENKQQQQQSCSVSLKEKERGGFLAAMRRYAASTTKGGGGGGVRGRCSKVSPCSSLSAIPEVTSAPEA